MARRSSRARDAQLSTFTAGCDSGLRPRLGGKRWTLVSGCEARADRRPLYGVTLIGKQILGWGTWIRTRVARVRAGSFAAKLSPITGWVAGTSGDFKLRMVRWVVNESGQASIGQTVLLKNLLNQTLGYLRLLPSFRSGADWNG